MNKEMTDEEFYSIQDIEELVDMCLTKDHNLKIFQSKLDQANKKLDKIKDLVDKEKQIFIHDYSCITPSNLEAKLWNNHGTELMDEVLSIIGGE